MITSSASHDHTLDHQLRVAEIQPAEIQPAEIQSVDADTNESSVASRICNIPHCAYRGTKVAVKYTYETIDANSNVASSILIVALLLFTALSIYNFHLCANLGASHPIITASTAIIAAIVTLIAAALAVGHYELFAIQESHPRLATYKVIVAAASIISIVGLAACLSGVVLITYHDKCTIWKPVDNLKEI